MTAGDPLAQSVKQRLLNLSRERNETFNLLLTRFCIERFLFRLTQTDHGDHFVLKGAMLFAAWTHAPYRPTQDLDLLCFGSPSSQRLAAVFREACMASVTADGVVFHAATVRVEPIREDNLYEGLRVRLLSTLGKARIPLQVDVGFGDAVTPAPQELQFTTLLDFPAPVLRAYAPETVVAEKLHAIIVLGMANSRMKDYFDLWTMSETMGFSAAVLGAAIAATFERRRTRVPDEPPVGLSAAFADQESKQKQWTAFVARIGVSPAPSLDMVVRGIGRFLLPLLSARALDPASSWPPGGPWR